MIGAFAPWNIATDLLFMIRLRSVRLSEFATITHYHYSIQVEAVVAADCDPHHQLGE
jgi:hypothetical protein